MTGGLDERDEYTYRVCISWSASRVTNVRRVVIYALFGEFLRVGGFTKRASAIRDFHGNHAISYKS